MKKIVLAAVAALAATAATPAVAQSENFTGLRVEATASVVDATQVPDTDDVTYGVAAGVDFALSDNVIAGVEASADNPFEDDRIVGAAARLGYVASENLLLYGKVGYDNYRDVFSRELDGLRLGVGMEYNISNMTFAKVEGRYTDFEAGVGNVGATVGLGLRF